MSVLQGALRRWRGTVCYCLLGQEALCCRLLSHGMDQHGCSLPTLTWQAKPVTMSAEKAVDHSRHKRWEDEVSLSCSSPATVRCGLARWVPSKKHHRAQPCLCHDNTGGNIQESMASRSLLPLSSEAHDGVYSLQLFSLQTLLLIPPGGRWFFSGHPGKPG